MATLWTGVRGVLLYSRRPGLQVCISGRRYLIAYDILKNDTFLERKEETLKFFPKKKDVLFETLALKLQNSDENILDEELKQMLYMCETKADVQLAKRCIQRYYEKAESIYFKFGPLFLRVCYEFGLVDLAFELLMDKSFRGTFSDRRSFNMLLDMLHQCGQYERALEALLEMKTQRVRLSSQTYLVTIAICYELNSLRSLETCTGLLEEAILNRITLPRLALCFAIALALKQEQYETALNVYDKILKKDDSLCCNLVLLITANTGSEEKVLEILESAELLNKFELCEEVMDVIGEKMKPTDLYRRFNDIYEKLRESGKISSLTLDGMLRAGC